MDQLCEDDLLCLVSYSGDVNVDLPLVRMSGPAKALAHRVIDLIDAEGSTALYSGLQEGMLSQLQVRLPAPHSSCLPNPTWRSAPHLSCLPNPT